MLVGAVPGQMFDGKSPLGLLCTRGLLFQNWCSSSANSGCDELGDLIGTKVEGTTMWSRGSTKFIPYTSKHLSINAQHLNPVGVSTEVHALSVCRTGITVLLSFPNLFYVAPKYKVRQNCFCKCMKVFIPAWIGLNASLRWAGRFHPAVCKYDLQEGELSHPWFVLVLGVWRKVGHLSNAFESRGAMAGFWIQCQQGRQCLWAVSHTGALGAVQVLWQAGQSQRGCLHI